jgi:hypothetical protein
MEKRFNSNSENIGGIMNFIIENKENLAEAVLALIAFLTVVARLTPTKSDEGILAKIDHWVNKIFDLLKLPNNKKKDE